MLVISSFNLKELFKDSWKVATTFIGTIVGAGFASGQEILKFFSHFGSLGILGIIISGVLFCLTGTLVMLIGRSIKASSFGDLVRHVCGKRLGPLMDFFLALFLFCSLSVMLAGAGAVFKQQWGIPYWIGIIITVIITIITVVFGIKGIINANSFVVPFMIVLCLALTIPSISRSRLSSVLSNFKPAGKGASPWWISSALLYVSYNLSLGISVLAPLGNEIRSKIAIIMGGILGGAGLGFLALLLDLAILSHYPASSGYEIPSLFVAGHLTKILQIAFTFILWAEIYTTIIGDIYGLSVRIANISPLSYNSSIFIFMSLALILSSAGFSALVGTIYPLSGLVSLFFFFSLFVYIVKAGN